MSPPLSLFFLKRPGPVWVKKALNGLLDRFFILQALKTAVWYTVAKVRRKNTHDQHILPSADKISPPLQIVEEEGKGKKNKMD